MRKIVLSLMLFLLAGNAMIYAQDYNKTDKQGRRQGPWVDFYANGQKRYEGLFKNDRCHGEFKYYDAIHWVYSVELGRDVKEGSYDWTP